MIWLLLAHNKQPKQLLCQILVQPEKMSTFMAEREKTGRQSVLNAFISHVSLTLRLTGARNEAKPTVARPVEPRVRHRCIAYG